MLSKEDWRWFLFLSLRYLSHLLAGRLLHLPAGSFYAHFEVKPMHYYGTRLSENISRREPEGYLLCLNVPVARTGTQEYLPEELGLPVAVAKPSGGNSVFSVGAEGVQGATGKPSGMISVFRPEDEVFSPATIASFEGMPVTNNHPPDGVDIGNIRSLQKGHAHNVRRGTGEESDLLLADLIITDPTLIDLILHEGKREISCGYTYDLCEENGQYIQRQIRGNHVAVVDAGRAGPRVCIRDQKTERSHPMKKSLTNILARMAKDGDIETVAEILEAVAGAENPTAEPAEENIVPAAAEAIADPAAVIETPEGTTITVDSDTVAEILSRLDKLVELIGGLVKPAADEDPAAGDPAAAEPIAEPAVEPDVIEEIVEGVEEALEAINAVEAVQAAGETEAAGTDEMEITSVSMDPSQEGVSPEEISELVAAVRNPEGAAEPDPALSVLSVALDPAGDSRPGRSVGDTLRTNLMHLRGELTRMSPKERRKLCADLAARTYRKSLSTGGVSYGDIWRAARDSRAARSKEAPDPRELGRRIQAERNVNYRNQKNLI